MIKAALELQRDASRRCWNRFEMTDEQKLGDIYE